MYKLLKKYTESKAQFTLNCILLLSIFHFNCAFSLPTTLSPCSNLNFVIYGPDSGYSVSVGGYAPAFGKVLQLGNYPAGQGFSLPIMYYKNGRELTQITIKGTPSSDTECAMSASVLSLAQSGPYGIQTGQFLSGKPPAPQACATPMSANMSPLAGGPPTTTAGFVITFCS